MSAVQALYVEPGGIYARLLGPAACWDEKRDARRYAGPDRVVAHPPCERWGRWAGPRVGDDGGCFAAALAAVLAYGGVLEHPAGSLAWAAHDLRAPRAGVGWIEAGNGLYTCSVEQGHYGHRARKATWLLCSRELDPPELQWGPSVATIQPRPGRDPLRERRIGAVQRMCRAERRRTPEPFARLLIGLAGGAL